METPEGAKAIKMKNSKGRNIVHAAASSGESWGSIYDIIGFGGGDLALEEDGDGCTPLCLAVSGQSFNTVDILLYFPEGRRSLKLVSTTGSSTLRTAAAKGTEEIMAAILKTVEGRQALRQDAYACLEIVRAREDSRDKERIIEMMRRQLDTQP